MSVNLTLATKADLDRERIRRHGFGEFARRAWPRVEPNALVWGWHLDAICEHLEALARRQIRDLVINVPPGFSKSRLASVLWPAWVWSWDPGRRFMCASYSEKLALRDARAMRGLVAGDWYQARWPQVQFPRDNNASAAAALFLNTSKGFRKSDTVRGQWTGEHGDDVMVDDPLDPQGAASSLELDFVLEWWTGTMPTRFRDHSVSTRGLIMQRLHDRDLTREFKRAGATVLCLPLRYESRHPDRWTRDPRTVEGELLCPARMGEAEASALEARMLSSTRRAAQLQQRPVAAGGNIFRAEWFRKFWVTFPDVDTWVLSVDCAFKKSSDSDKVSITVWASKGATHYLIDRRTERMSFTETLTAIKAMCVKWPKVASGRKVVEDKANGEAVVDALKSEVPGLVLFSPGSDSKEGRAIGVTHLFEAGNVVFPHPDLAQYPDGSRGAFWFRGGMPFDQEPAEGSYEHTMTFFPKAANDDDVDGTTQYFRATHNDWLSKFKTAWGGR